MSRSGRTLLVVPNIEATQWRGIHQVGHALAKALRASGRELGLLTGFPRRVDSTGIAGIDERLANRNLHHYVMEGRFAEPFAREPTTRLHRGIRAAWGIAAQSAEFPTSGRHAHEFLNELDFVVNVPYVFDIARWSTYLYGPIVDQLANRHGIDLVVTAAPLALRRSRYSRYSVVQFVHDTIPLDIPQSPAGDNAPLSFARTLSTAVEGADVVLVNSQATETQVRSIFPAATVRNVYAHHTSSPPQPSEYTRTVIEEIGLRDRSYLLFTSAVEERKNVKNLMLAFQASSGFHSLSLAIAGEPGHGYDEMQELYQSLRPAMRARIKFLGYVPSATRTALYRHAQAFVFPSHYEGFGLPILEAMEHGLPIVTTRRGAIPEVAEDCVRYIDDPNNVAEIAAELCAVAGIASIDATTRVRYEVILQRFSEQAFSRRVKVALDELPERPVRTGRPTRS